MALVADLPAWRDARSRANVLFPLLPLDRFDAAGAIDLVTVDAPAGFRAAVEAELPGDSGALVAALVAVAVGLPPAARRSALGVVAHLAHPNPRWRAFVLRKLDEELAALRSPILA